MHQLQQMKDKAKEKCIESFRLLHSHLKALSIKGRFERACVTLFDQDNQAFIESLLLNLDNLEKQLDKEEFQEIESIEYTRTEIQTITGDTLIPTHEFPLRQESEGMFQASRSGKDTHAEDSRISTSVNDKQPLLRQQLTVQHDTLLLINTTFYFQSEPIYGQTAVGKSANHDVCITKFLKEVNSRVKIQSPKTRDSTKPVEPTSHTHRPSRRIVIGHRFSPNKSSVVPTGKKFTSSTTKVDCEPLNGSKEDTTNSYECNQTLNVSACTLNLSAGTSFNPKKERLKVWLLKKLMSKNQVPQGIHKQKQSPNSSQGVKEQQQQRSYFDDPYHELLHKVYISQGSSSNVHK
ncbi:hypothetical protein Tco_0613843 [Tanacetum coccineum]